MTDKSKAAPAGGELAKAETVKVTIDGLEVDAPKGALIIRVAEQLGIAIPRFCDHPLLKPAGACRQCLVEVAGQRKPVTSCTTPVAEGMVVNTQLTSEVARKGQEGIMELLLINHPLDCPVCDKGGECPLQNQAMSSGRPESRFVEAKRQYPKPLAISTQVLLDRERCVLCQRCTRFSDEIAGDRFIDLMERSSAEQIGIFAGTEDDPASGEPFNSYFSGNTVQICPVGALTGAQYRFRARPFDLVSTPNVCEHCSAGCAQRADHRRGKVLRRLAGDDAAVNEEWNCDKGRWAFQYAAATDRITAPMVRGADGKLYEVSWPEALEAAARGLRAARDDADRAGGVGDAGSNGDARGVGVLTGGRLTVEDAYAYAKFARVALHTNDIDFRARPLSGQEAEFLGSAVVGRSEVTYADLERAPVVVLAGLEPEDECPILFLRLRKAHLAGGLRVLAVAPVASRGLAKLDATVVLTAPGDEAAILETDQQVRAALAEPGAVLLVGERLASSPNALAAAQQLAEGTGASLAWVPRRAGDRGAVEAGCLPNLLPGGRLVTDPVRRAELASAWGVAADELPATVGRDTDAIIAAAAAGSLGGLLVAGVDPGDLADPRLAVEALDKVGFVVSLELRHSAVTSRADVVLPIAPAVEKTGSYLNWEGRVRPFTAVLRPIGSRSGVSTAALSDAQVLDALARALDVELGSGHLPTLYRELAAVASLPLPGTPALERLGAQASDQARAGGAGAAADQAGVSVTKQDGKRGGTPAADRTVRKPQPGTARLATWRQLIDLGSLQDGDEHLAGTARPALARISKATAADLGAVDGDPISVSTERGTITLPAAVSEMADGVVWLPMNSPGSTVHRTLGVTSGALVKISSGGSR